MHEVVIVGAGPVGLTLARLLGLRGHRVLILERKVAPYPLPRAVHFDDEIGRIFGDIGLAEQICAISGPVRDHYEWRNANGETLVRMDWSGIGPSGWPTANFFAQPQLEEVLGAAVDAMAEVTLMRGVEVVGISETTHQVVVDSAERSFTARFVIGCDGANSFVRTHMDTRVHDLGFFFDWLIVDTIPHEQREWSPQNWQLCDPARPTTIVSGGPGRRRWEFMRLPGENKAELNTEEKAWELLAAWDRHPDNTTLERHALYTFAARWAEQWNRGRIAIAGDAAHQMPPFAGQGMCSGLRDAANLSWKLDMILRGESAMELLDTYTSERSAHLQHAIGTSVELGKVICVLDEAAAAQRDRQMIALGADPARVLPVGALPVLGPGVIARIGSAPELRGTLLPQFPVYHQGARRLLDAATGYGTILLTLDELAIHDVPVFAVGAQDPSGEWASWFARHEISAVLVRPDHYIFGAASRAADIPALVDHYHDIIAHNTQVGESRECV